MDFKTRLIDLQSRVELYIANYLKEMSEISRETGIKELFEAMQYSLRSGGARIRPILSLLTAETLGDANADVLGLGCAVELIHTYSLIHDDLPCMDNDDFRRGKPSNHKVYGEALAILAGDALSTEAFLLLARTYKKKPGLALELIKDLALASGHRGMAGGQAVDLVLKQKNPAINELLALHMRKTGVLLRNSILGAAKVCGATEAEMKSLDRYAEALGLTFQIADDIADDLNPDGLPDGLNDEPNFVKVVGLENAKVTCTALITSASDSLAMFKERAEGLKGLIHYIFERTQPCRS